MTTSNEIVNSFVGGEFSPSMYGRSDLRLYNNAAKTLTNIRVRPQGGADRRSGTVFCAEVIDHDVQSKLINFEESTAQSYIIELGNLKMRFFKDTDQLREAAKTITGITNANPGVVTSSSHGYSNGDHVWIHSVAGMTQVNNRRFTVANKTTNTFELSGVDTSASEGYGTHSGTAGRAEKIVEIATPYTEAQLEFIQTVQDQGTMYFVHPDHPVKKLTRASDTSWTLATVDFVDGPYLPDDTTGATLTLGGTSGSVSVTASSSTFAATDTTGTNGTGSYDRLIQITDGSNKRYIKITAFTSATVVTGAIQASTGTFSGTGAFSTFRLGAFSSTTGFPAAAFIAEQRLILAGTTSKSQTYFYSKSGFLEDFTPGTDDDDATSYDIASRRANPVRWVSGIESDVISATSASEWRRTGTIKPTDSAIRCIGYEGSAKIEPVETPEAIAYVHQTKSLVQALTVKSLGQQIPTFENTNLSYTADHLSGGGFKQLAYSHYPYRNLLALRNDGKIACCTYDKKQGVTAWSTWETSGNYESVAVASVSASATTIEQTDRVWTSVKRELDTPASCTITVTDASNIAAGTTITFTTQDGVSTTLTATADDPPSGALFFSLGDGTNNGVADNIAIGTGAAFGINAVDGFSAANPAANVITVIRDVAGGANTTVTSSDPTRIAVTNFTGGTTTKRYIEYEDDSTNTDCAMLYSGSSTTSPGGLWHLLNHTATMKVDAAIVAAQRVSMGNVTLTAAGTAVEAGIEFSHTISTLPMDVTLRKGSTLGTKRRITQAMLLLRDSLGGTVEGDPILFRDSGDAMDSAPDPFTGILQIVPNTAFSRSGEVTITGSQPYDFNLNGLVLITNVEDR